MTQKNIKDIFFAELDDDYQVSRSLTRQKLHERTSCYYLLAPRIIIHPAYIWQSEMTHHLINGAAGDLLRPPFAQLELGNCQGSRDYMRYRLERLGSPAQPTRELRQYQAHKDALFEEAGILDARFDSASSRPVSTACRDKEFRDLLFRDLQATDLDRVSLAAQLGAFRVDPSQADEGRKLAKQMQRFVRNSNLVSVDTVRARIRRYGFDELEDSEDLQRRLLALYYQTYADDQTIIPATSKLLLDQVINYYDADIFWNVMSRMFGNHSRLLASLEIPEAAGALRRIRESDDWTAFTAMYFNTLQTVDETLWSQPDSVIRTFDSKNPPRSTTFILKRLWSRRKIDLAGAAFGAVALASSAAPFGTGEEIGATAAGIASIGLGGIGLVRYIHRFIEEYKSQDMMKVKDTIKREVHQVLAAIRSESRQTD